MSSQPLSIATAELTVEEPQLLRLPDTILDLLDTKGSSALFLIQQHDLCTLTLRTVADLIDNAIVPRIPSDLVHLPEFASTPLFEDLSALARALALLPQTRLRSDGILEIPEAVVPLPPGTRLRIHVANPLPPSASSAAAALCLLVQPDELPRPI